jgi:hypothetical protein
LSIDVIPVDAVTRRLNVRSASLDRLIIFSTGLAIEQCVLSQRCAAVPGRFLLIPRLGNNPPTDYGLGLALQWLVARTINRHDQLNSTPDTNETKQALHRNLAETSAK